MKRHTALLCVTIFLLLAWTGCVPAPVSCPDTITVTTAADGNDGHCDDHCTLREAIILANSCPGMQTINVPPAGYQLTLVGTEEDAAATGDLDITDDLILEGTAAPSIDGLHADRIFDIFGDIEVHINHFILMFGQAQLGGAIRSQATNLYLDSGSIHDNAAIVPPGGAGASSGGGIFVEAGTTKLDGTQVFGNSADYGGGIHNFATATFTMTGGLLRGNTSSGWGGGLWNNMAATAILNNVEISENTADERGAGIYNNGVLETNIVTFNQNVVTGEGGGLFNDDNGNVTMRTTWFTNNNADLGGAIFNVGALNLYQSSITINTAFGGFGGAIYNDGASASLLMQNTTISGNMIVPFAAPGGSGIYNNGGVVTVEFSTIAYNNADGIGNSGGTVTLHSSILASHGLGNCSGVMGGSLGYNLEDQDTCDFVEPSDLVDTIPLLMGLEASPWSPDDPTLSHSLSPGSPAIDTGDTDNCVAVDQHGVSRPQGAGCDRGAVEMEAVPASIPMALAISNAHCRRGPDTGYDSFAMLGRGQSYEIRGRDLFSNWWQVALQEGVLCWVADSQVEVTGDTSGVAIVDVLPVSTDTPTPVVGCYIQKRCMVPCPAGTQNEGPCTP